MKKILVPTDFSDCAANAVQVAKKIALKSSAELFLLHLEEVAPQVTHVLHHQNYFPHSQEGLMRYNLQHDAELAEMEGIKVHPVFIPSSNGERIEDYIHPLDIDLVVMGSHGAKGIHEAFIGSNTQHLVRHAHVPVLVVKHPDRNFHPERIVFASTFRNNITRQLKEVMNFARLWNAEVDLVFINLVSHLIEEHEAEKKMRIQMKEAGVSGCTLNVVETNDEETGIMEFATEVHADVIALVMDLHTGLNRLFSSSVAEKLTNHSVMPVLVMNP